MSDRAGLILRLDQVARGNLAEAGGKAARLGELFQAQFPVPPAFVVAVEAYRRFLAESGLEPEIRTALASVDPEDSANLTRVADGIRRRVLDATVPRAVARAIRHSYSEMGGGCVAVRSSATAEDLPEASFAGQQSTFLNVEGAEAVVAAVRRCWASLFEARAIYYRAQGGWDHLDVGLAVVVQRMVQADVAGVMFTADPTTHDPSKLVIEAAYGLGEAVVSGAVTPDHYVIDKATGGTCERRISEQDRELKRVRADGLVHTRWEPVPDARRRRAKLVPSVLRELAALARRIEAHYGAAQDIEWAVEAGQPYILQARPLTTAARPFSAIGSPPTPTAAPILRGAPASPGIASGPVRIVDDANALERVRRGDVLVAETTSPDFVPAMRRAAAIVTKRGGRTCHAAIISREFGVPCVVGTGDALDRLSSGDVITVDGCEGRVWAGRDESLIAWWNAQPHAAATLAGPRTRTRIYVNLADPGAAEDVAGRDVDGVGLLRAEFMIAQMGRHPRLLLREGHADQFRDQLAAGIRRIAAAFAPRPVVYRASDFKTNEYRRLEGGEEYEPVEANPMLGYRGAARYIHEPELFKLELAALRQVSQECENLHLMIPFVRTPGELATVARMVASAGLRRGPHFQLWMMVEVPSNVILLDEFIDEGLDGLSIGSNDLTQLILGVDRDNERLADLFDERNPAVLRALEQTLKTARRRNVTVSICGQGPSQHPDFAEWLVARGITSVSVTPDVIDATRRVIADTERRLGVSGSNASAR